MCAILIVDGKPADRDRLRTLLTPAGFDVHEAARGAEVLPKLHEAQPDAVLLGANLPDTDGPALCRAIRSRPEWACLPILLVLSRDDPPEVLAALNAGADDYIHQGAPGEAILARLRRLVHDRQMARLATLNEGLVQIGRLLAGIIHEIRGPIAVIRGHAEILRMEFPGLSAPDDRLEPIIQSCQFLQVRLEHLMAAVRGGSAAYQPLEIPALLEEAADLFRKSTISRTGQITILTDCPDPLPPVLGDFGRLLQVFLNLLGNAHEAITSGNNTGQIRLTAMVDRADDRDWLRVDVADNGPGLPEAHLGRIFEPFFTTKSHGSGFGLYLADAIIREHAGRITARNLPTGGACLSVWLPLETPNIPARSTP